MNDYGDDYGYGDPRRCPAHPWVQVSSPCGLHDGICGLCEAAHEPEPEPGEASPPPAPVAVPDDDDLPF